MLSHDVLEKIVDVHNRTGGSSIGQDGADLVGYPGYAVSVFPNYGRIICSPRLAMEDVIEYAELIEPMLEADPAAFIGTWEHLGQSHLDISVLVTDRKMAIDLARIHGQEAVYDLTNGISIRVPVG